MERKQRTIKNSRSCQGIGLHTGEETIIHAKGFFVAIGHTPNTSLFKGQLDMDENGYLHVEAGTSKTKIPYRR